MKKKIIVILIALPIVVFFVWEAIFTFRYYTNQRIPDRFILPNAYQGWVLVEWKNQDCPKIVEKDGYYIYQINKKGHSCTKSEPKKGWATNWYEYQGQPEKNLMQNPKSNLNRIWHEDHIQYKDKPIYIFYVGNYKLDKNREKSEMISLNQKLKDLIK